MFNQINKKITMIKDDNAKQYVMDDKRETLRDFVRRVTHEKDLKYRDVARRAQGRISAATVAQIINNKAGELKPLKVMALAEGLGEPVDLLFTLAYPGLQLRPDGFTQSRFEHLYTLYEKLPESERRELNSSLEMLKTYMEKRIRQPIKPTGPPHHADSSLSRTEVLDEMETLMDRPETNKKSRRR